MILEGRKRGEPCQVNFLLPALIRSLFGISPYDTEKFDLGHAFQTSLKSVEYGWACFSDALSNHT